MTLASRLLAAGILFASLAPGQNTGIVEGRVTDIATGKPLPGARLHLWAADQHYATADDQGRFRFSAIDPALHHLDVQFPGYMHPGDTPTQYSQFAQLVPTSQSAPLDIQMQAYASISGRVLDATGDPAEDVYVSLLVRRRPLQQRATMERSEGAIGNDELSTTLTATTDDHGVFRFSRILPGHYYLSAQGIYHSDPSYRKTYYPQALYPAQAVPITIESPGEFANLQFSLIHVAGVRISGRLLDASTGQPISAQARIALWPQIAPLNGRVARSSPNATFTFADSPPGEYILDAGVMVPGNNQPMTSGARQTLTVSDRDIENLEITLHPAIELTGTVSFQPGCAPAPVILGVVRAGLLMPAISNTRIESPGAFTFRGIAPGKWTIQLTVQSYGPHPIVAARMQGRDVREGFEIPADIPPLDLVIGCATGGRP